MTVHPESVSESFPAPEYRPLSGWGGGGGGAEGEERRRRGKERDSQTPSKHKSPIIVAVHPESVSASWPAPDYRLECTSIVNTVAGGL